MLIWSLSRDLLCSCLPLACTALVMAVPCLSRCQLGSSSPVPAQHPLLPLPNSDPGGS